jgi:hypothetical protein
MCHQFAHGMPGLEESAKSLSLNLAAVSPGELADFHQRAFAAEDSGWQLEPERAAGYHHFVQSPIPRAPRVLKGQVTGPVSMGSYMVDGTGKPVLYDRCAMELVATQLRQLARGQERELGELASRAWPGQDVGTLVFVDEPYLASYGSAYFTLGRDEVIAYINWVMDGLRGLKGVHCCGNTDWSILLATSVDVLSFDAYGYGDALMLYAREVAEFFGRGGYLSWGIVPSQGDAARKETAANLVGRLLQQAGRLTRHGLSLHQVLEHSLVTPACGLGSQTPEDAEYIARLTHEVSAELRRLIGEGSVT